MKGIITDIQRFCLDDGPGIRSAVFLKGCPLCCAWCHNPETISPNPTAEFGREVDTREVLEELLRDEAFYRRSGGGVTFTGGEPFAQPEFLDELLSLSKRHGLHTAAETSGAVPWEHMRPALRNTGLLLYDYKLTDSAALRCLTGADKELIMSNLDKIASLEIPVILRMPVIPGINDDREHFRAAAALRKTYANISGIELLPYHTIGKDKWAKAGMEYRLPGLAPPTAAQVMEWKNILLEEEAANGL